MRTAIKVCFWSQEPIGVLVFNRLADGLDIPHNVIVDYELCGECETCAKMARTWAGRIIIYEGDQGGKPLDGRPPFQDGVPDDMKLYPTGRWLALNREHIHIVFKDPSDAATVLKDGLVFVSRKQFNFLMKQIENARQ